MRRLLCALALAAVNAAHADPIEADTIAAPGAIASGMIAAAGADGLFELFDDGQVSLRHVSSGMICRFPSGSSGGRIVLFPGLPRGDDVACDVADGRETTTLYATRLPFETSLDDLIASAETALRQRFPDARAYSAAAEAAADGILPPIRTAQFMVTRSDGALMYTRVSVALVNGWAIKQRYTSLAPDDAAALQGELTSRAIWRGALGEIVARPSPDAEQAPGARATAR